MRVRRLLLATTLLVPLLLAAPATAQADGADVRLDAIGSPSWRPAGCQVFAAPVGTAASGYAEAQQTVEAILPPPDHTEQLGVGLAIGPGAPHAGPYTAELRDGVRALGFDRGNRFDVEEFSAGSGVYLTCMVVPRRGATGSSPDFAAGPIIPNSLFPMQAVAVATKDGAAFDPNLANFSVPALDAATGYDVDGHSHFPIFFVTNQDFWVDPGPDLRGRYRYEVTFTDVSGEGWRLRADFRIR